MRMNMTLLCAIMMITALLSFSADSGKADDPMQVFVTIEPQAYVLERIGGSHVSVNVLVGPGQSPHSYEPTPKQMTALAKCRMYFEIGLPLEQRILTKIQAISPDIQIVKMQAGIPLRHYPHSLEFHAEEHEETHDHSAYDPHIWMNPQHVRVMAQETCRKLIDTDPRHQIDYSSNLDQLLKELIQLHADISTRLSPFAGQSFFVFHPSCGYFADQYGLREVSVEMEGKSPSAKQLAQVIHYAKQSQVSVIFVQPQFSQKTAQSVADAVGASVVILDPLARDYIQNIRDMTIKLETAFKTKQDTSAESVAK